MDGQREAPREGSSTCAGWKRIYIEITNRCNLACSFCTPSQRPKENMPVLAFAEVLARIAGATRHIALHVLGEPLLHPELDDIFALCHTHGLRVNCTTNGTLLVHHRQILLTTPALRQLSCSLHSLVELEREAAKACLESIIAFSQEASRTSGLYVSLRLWNLGENCEEEVATGTGWLLERLAEAFGLPALNGENMRSGRGITLAPRVFLNPEPRFTWPQLVGPDLGGQGYCRGLRDHLAILVDGTVVPCCLDAEGNMALGNIFSHSLADILAGQRAQRMRDGFGHQRLVESLCRRCSYRLRFGDNRPA